MREHVCQRLGAFFLLALFTLPLGITEWHRMDMARSINQSLACGHDDSQHICDLDRHELHHCVLCDFRFTHSFLPPATLLHWVSDLVEASPPGTRPTHYGTLLFFIPDGRGPPFFALGSAY